MKTLSTTLLVLSLALSAAASPPGDQLAAADNATMPAPSSAEWRSSEIKSPHDFGPSEPIVTERDTTAFRKPGTLLSRTS